MIDFKALIKEDASNEAELNESVRKQISKQVANQLTTGIMVLDDEFNVVIWNRFLQVHSDKNADEVLGHSIFEVFDELPVNWLMRKLTSVMQLNTPSFCSWQQRHHLFELPHTRPITTDSEFMAQNCTFLPVPISQETQYVCILIEDVTDVCHYQSQLQKALSDLAHVSRIDCLTQVYNRRHWQESLNQEYTKACRHKKPLSLIMLDLDHFKSVNDTYGHQCGDKVLIEVSHMIKDLLRVEDVFGRYGGEEFVITLPETNLVGASELANRICQKVANTPFSHLGETLNLSVSLGVAELASDMKSYDDLVTRADDALYQAKADGRNRVCAAKDISKVMLG